MTRALRILLVANDGFSAGHVVRTLAVARGLARGAARRGIELASILATTSEADALLAREDLAIVRLPAPARARRAGVTDADRRRLVQAAIAATVDSFAPDLMVVDTFPNGPHGELAGIGRSCKRALVRRAVPDERVDLLTTGLGNYDRLIAVDDAGLAGASSALPSTTVPPIVLVDPPLSRDASRSALGLPLAGRVIAVAAGGGGDADGAAFAESLASAIATLDPAATIVLAEGPLAASIGSAANVRPLRVAPLQPYLAAFDAVVSSAGYNTAHELAAARVPAILFPLPRPFDDQAARAARLAAAGHARVLGSIDELAGALAWAREARCPGMTCDGADRAADALFELVGAR